MTGSLVAPPTSTISSISESFTWASDKLLCTADVAALSSYGVFNFRGEQGYTLDGTSAVICGSDESFFTKIFPDMLTEGHFPQTADEAMVTENARGMMGLNIGDEVTIDTPDGGKLTFNVSAFVENTSHLMSGDYYGVFITTEKFRSIYPADNSRNS